jgi:hypothetical protein
MTAALRGGAERDLEGGVFENAPTLATFPSLVRREGAKRRGGLFKSRSHLTDAREALLINRYFRL